MGTTRIAVRIARTTWESTIIQVPVTNEVMDDGGIAGSINVQKLFAKAVEMAGSEGVEWTADQSVTRPHDVQG